MNAHVIGQPAAQGVYIAGEVELGDDDLVPLAVAEIQAAEEDAVGDAGILVYEDCVRVGAHQRGDLVPDSLRQLEPAAAPSGNALLRPSIGVGVETVVHATRHSA